MSIADHTDARGTGFPSPFEVTIPRDCEGWEQMYASHVLFGEDRRAFEESRFWFQDGLHAAEPLYPFDSFAFEYAVVALNQASSRLFVVPPSLGVECRILNGYVYVSANLVTDAATLVHRAELFSATGRLLLRPLGRAVRALAREGRGRHDGARRSRGPLSCAELEDESIVTEGRGLGSSHALLHAYDRLLEGVDRIFQYHFEFLNSRLRGVPRLLRAMPTGIPGHFGPDHREDGVRDRRARPAPR